MRGPGPEQLHRHGEAVIDRQFLARGDVELVGIEDGVVKVRLQGACAGCPMSQMTLKMGIEKVLKQNIPEISRVDSV